MIAGLSRTVGPRLRDPRAIGDAVGELRDILSGRLVAYIAGVTEARAVNEWAEGIRSIRSPDTEASDEAPVVQA